MKYLLTALLLIVPNVLEAQSVWTLKTVFSQSGRDIVAIAQVEDSDEYFIAAQLDNGSESRLYLKRWDPVLGLSSRVNIGRDGLGVLRLDTTGGEQYLPTLAIDTGTDLLVGTKADAVGFGPTIENPVLDRVHPFAYVDDPPLLVDDNAVVGSVEKRKHSALAVNAGADTVFACWTVDDGNDDVYCRSRTNSSTIWSNPAFALAATTAVEEHATVAVLNDGTRVVLYADGSADGVTDTTNLAVSFFDTSDTLIGTAELGETRSNWPHMILEGDVLHATWFNTATDEPWYGTCDTFLLDCTNSANWTEELINGVPNRALYPQIAVDSAGEVFVAYTHRSGAGDERVAINARCSAGSWDGEIVDGTQGKENLGGDHVRHAYPAFAYRPGNNKLSVVYQRQDLTSLEFEGLRAAQDSTDFHNCMCGGPC